MCLLHRYGGRFAAMYEFDGRIYIVGCKNVEALTRKTTDCVKISAGSTRLGININTLGLFHRPHVRVISRNPLRFRSVTWCIIATPYSS